MGTRRNLALTLLGAALALVLCMSASASAAPFTIPSTTSVLDQPSVAMDASGNAYVAWTDENGSDTPPVAVCELPAGTQTCLHTTDLTNPGLSDGVTPYVYVDKSGNPHVVFTARNGAGATEIDYESTDHGVSWPSTGPTVGDLNLSSSAFDPAIGNGIVFGTTNSPPVSGPTIQANAAQLGGTTPADATLAPTGSEGALHTGTAVSDTSAGISVASVWDSGLSSGTNGVSYSYYAGPALKGLSAASVQTDVGSSANWSTHTIGDNGSQLSLAGGPAGIFLNESIGSAGEVAIRKFNGTGFGAAAVSDCGGTPTFGGGLQDETLSEDPVSGDLHFVYIEANGEGTDSVLYTELGNGTQSAPVSLFQTANHPSAPRVASDGSANAALAIWRSGGSSTDSIQADWLPAVALTGCPSSSGGGGGGTTLPTTTQATIGDQTLTLVSPSLSVCVNKTSKLTVKLSSKSFTPRKGKATKVKFKKADFYIDRGVKHVHKVKIKIKKKPHGSKAKKKGKTKFKKVTTYGPNATAHHLPATENLKLTGLKSGTHTLTVKVFFTETKTKHHRKTTITVSTTLKAKFKIC